MITKQQLGTAWQVHICYQGGSNKRGRSVSTAQVPPMRKNKAQLALSMDVALTAVVGLSSPFVKGERGGFDLGSVSQPCGNPPSPPFAKGGEPYFRPTPLITR
jgi:hypothetical protein